MATRQQSLALITVIGLGFALTGLTRYRIEGLPIGFSELILLACILLHIPLGHGIHGGNQPNRFVPLLICLFLLMLPGYFMTLAEEGAVPFALYNLIASAWIVIVFVYLQYGFDHDRVGLDRLIQVFVMFSTVYLGIVLALSVFDPDMVYLLEEVEELRIRQAEEVGGQIKTILRLVGFAANPNQLALHALAVAFLSLRLF